MIYGISMCEINYFFFIIFLTCVFAKDGPLIKTPNGLIKGKYQTSTNGRTFSSFDGIPYAKPPINKLRFREPIPIEPWLGVLIADTQYVCMQYANGTVLGQEDCLYINVYVPRETPDPEEKLDVIVHIHGGAFMVGAGHMYTGPNHFMDRDVVFVNFNYRLGPFGFLSSGDRVIPGNYGLKDQTAALQWVKDNIQVFGGNPDSVTITGLSAGGASVHLHYFSNMSKELFHRGIAQSGSALNPWAIKNDPFDNTKKLATAVGCFDENVKIVLSCLRQRSALQMAENIKLFYVDMFLPLAPFAPVVEFISESTFMNVHPYMQLLTNRVLDKPLIMSMTTEEGVLPSGLFYHKLDVLNEKWEKLSPLMMEYYNEPEDKQHEVSKKIKEHYFNDDAISKENFEQFLKLCSQRLFHAGAELSLRMQAKITNSPVYLLMMGYSGESSMSKYYLGIDDKFGVGHGDDAKFYYNLPMLNNKLNKEEKKMKDDLLDMVVTYAKTGKPTITNVEWKPVDDGEYINYLQIKGPDDISMKKTKELSPNNFWNSLGLRENENAYVLKGKFVEVL